MLNLSNSKYYTTACLLLLIYHSISIKLVLCQKIIFNRSLGGGTSNNPCISDDLKKLILTFIIICICESMVLYDLHFYFHLYHFHVWVKQLPDHASLVEWAILRGNDFTGNLIRRIQPDIGMSNGCDYETICVKTILKYKKVGKIPEIKPFKV